MTSRDRKLEREIVQAWRSGKPAKDLQRITPPTSVLSVRLPWALLDRLAERAKAEGKHESELARDLIERGLSGDPAIPADLARLFSRWVEEGATVYDKRKRRESRGGYPSGSKPISAMKPPPKGPASGGAQKK